MIKIECDACEKIFEVEPKHAGRKVPCPHCGDINRVPPAHSRAATASPQPVPAETTVAVEKVLMIVRPAMFRAHPFRFMLIAIMFLGGMGVVFWSLSSEQVGTFWGWLGLIVALFGGGWWVVWWIKTHLWIKATVTNLRTVRQEGIIRRHTTEVMHNHVRSVNIRQNVLQRIMNVGYLGIDSAGQSDIEIEVKDIPAPFKVRGVIDKHRQMTGRAID